MSDFRAAILALLSDGKHRTVKQIADALKRTDRSRVSDELYRAGKAGAAVKLTGNFGVNRWTLPGMERTPQNAELPQHDFVLPVVPRAWWQV